MKSLCGAHLGALAVGDERLAAICERAAELYDNGVITYEDAIAYVYREETKMETKQTPILDTILKLKKQARAHGYEVTDSFMSVGLYTELEREVLVASGTVFNVHGLHVRHDKYLPTKARRVFVVKGDDISTLLMDDAPAGQAAPPARDSMTRAEAGKAICGAHGQPQFLLGQVLPCPSPGCGNGPKGETHEAAVMGTGALPCRVRFIREYKRLTEETGLWRWAATPSIADDDAALATKLRLDGWESAIVKHAAAAVKKAKPKIDWGQIQVPDEFRYGMNAWLPPASQNIGQQIAELQNAIANAQAQAAIPRMGVPADRLGIKQPKKPQRREVSHNGRNWVNYDSLTDADAFDVYPHRRVDGVVQAAIVTPLKTVGEYAENCLERRAYTPRSEFVRAKKPEPWRPSVADTDLLPDVG